MPSTDQWESYEPAFKMVEDTRYRRYHYQRQQRNRRGSDETDEEDDDDYNDEYERQPHSYGQVPMRRCQSPEMDAIRRCTSEGALRSSARAQFQASVMNLPPLPIKTVAEVADGRRHTHEHPSNARRLFSHFNRSMPIPTSPFADNDDEEEDAFDSSFKVR